MDNPNINTIANILVEHSTRVKKSDVVQIIADKEAEELALEVYRLVLQKGAFPRLKISIPGTSFIYFKYANKEQLNRFPEIDMYEIKKTDAVIYIGAPTNTRELSSVDPKKIALRQKILRPIQEYRVEKTKWVLFYYPTYALAQESEMSYEEFRRFVFDAVNVDYKKMSKGMDKLKKFLDKADTVHVMGKNTDLRFSVKGRIFKKGDGECNIPDGELFTGPVENSINGFIEFDYPIVYQSQEIAGIRLEFKNGKIVNESATKNEKLLKTILDTDKGSRHIGEWGIGTNYNIQRYIKNILFDEKIGGTVHFAVGNSYKETKGRNVSSVHWDMVKDLRQGGKIIVDGKVIQENGKFKI